MVSHHLPNINTHKHCGSGDAVLVFSGDLTRLRNQRVMWPYGQEPLIAGYHLGKFGGHRHFGSGDITILVCHVISQD